MWYVFLRLEHNGSEFSQAVGNFREQGTAQRYRNELNACNAGCNFFIRKKPLGKGL